MRYSPTRAHVVMERGQHPADGARRLEVVDAAAGTVQASFPGGYNPRWLSSAWIVAEAPDGAAREVRDGGFTVEYVPANRGQLDARGGIYAVSDLSVTWLGNPTGRLVDIQHAREPRVGNGLGVAVRGPDGRLRYEPGGVSTPVDLGPCEDSRWDSGTLVWWLEGRVWGRTTIDQPTAELTVPGRACAKPCPLWTGSLLYVGLVLDAGELVVCEWGSLVRGEAKGWKVGTSSGAGFDWAFAPDGNRLRVVYFDPFGKPVYQQIDTTQPPVSLARPVTPQPPPDIPWTTTPGGVVEDIWPWIRDNCTALSPDGAVAWILKSDEANFEGQTHGEHWDADGLNVGHLEDSSTGYRWWAAGKKRVNAIDWVALGEPEPWASLPLERNYWDAGARLWLPRRCVSGTVIRYVTNIRWSPSGYVQPNIVMEITIDVGYARINGREAFVRGIYGSSDNGGRTFNREPNLYGPTGWVTHTPAGSNA